jgi:hypothetical protein
MLFNVLGRLDMEGQLINFPRLLKDFVLQCDESNDIHELLHNIQYTYLYVL